MINNIKIPAGCYKKAKDKNLLNEVSWYYEFKIHADQSGFISKKQLTQGFKRLGSRATIYNRMTRLIYCGLVKKVSNGYQIVKYDRLFELLGYDMSKCGHRKGTFKVHKIPAKEIKNIKVWMAFVDIRDNLNNQISVVWSKLQRLYPDRYTVKNSHNLGTKRQILKDLTKFNVQTIKDRHQAIDDYEYAEARQIHTPQHLNTDITLSLSGICNILGLSNTSSAYKIVSYMEGYGLLISKRRTVMMGATIEDKVDNNRFYIDGSTLFARIPNKIEVV